MGKQCRLCCLLAILVVALFGWWCGCGSEPAPPAPQAQPLQPISPGQNTVQPLKPVQPMQPGQVAAQPVLPAQPPPPIPPDQPTLPDQSAQDPLSGLLGVLGQAAGGQQVPSGVGNHIPWQNLSGALPRSAPGWTLDGQIQGESANIMGISVSRAACQLKQGNLTAKVEIVDTTMNPMLAMPFNMARAVRIDSAEERMGPIDFGAYPGTQKFEKRRKKTEVFIMVKSRILITVTVRGSTSEAPAIDLARHVNFAHLAQLAGG